MQKIKKIAKTIIKFIVVMVIICFIITLFKVITNSITPNEIISKIGLYFLYTIGYGAMEGDALLQQILAMVGIVGIALMTTYLTINLFWRLDDVILNKNIEVKKNTLYFKFKNNGQCICDVKSTFVLYNKNESENICEPREYNIPILMANSNWIVKCNLDDTFWYQALYYLYTDDNIKLYCSFSFVDSTNGQGSIRVEEIKKEYFINYNLEKLLSTKTIKNQNFHNIASRGTNFIEYDENRAILKYSFEKDYDDNEFAMLYLNFHEKNLNLEKFLPGTYIEFQAESIKNAILHLEIKSTFDSTFTKELHLSKATQTYIVNLSEINFENKENIREICFTFFKRDNLLKNTISISDIKIISNN